MKSCPFSLRRYLLKQLQFFSQVFSFNKNLLRGLKKNYLILFYLNVLVTNKIVNFFLKALVSDRPVPNTLSMVAYDNPFSKMFEPSLVATTFMNSRGGGLRELWLKLIPFQIFWHWKNFIFFTFPFQEAPTFRLSQAIAATNPLSPLVATLSWCFPW